MTASAINFTRMRESDLVPFVLCHMVTFTPPHYRILLIVVVALLTLFFFRYLSYHSLTLFTSSVTGGDEKPLPIALEVAGEVKNPGIYGFDHEVTLAELIEEAGGLKGKVALSPEHFSTTIPNGAKVIIAGTTPCIKIEMMEAQKRLLYFIPIDVNTANVEELMAVPYIGERTAQAIISYRQVYGRFAQLDDLRKVRGINRYNFEKMKASLTCLQER